MKKYVGFSPRASIEGGVKKLIEWDFRNNTN